MIIFSIASIVACYFIGAIPTAYLLVKAIKGVDIRDIGSGNVGATNAGRVLGYGGFIFVLVLDLLKGFIPIYVLYFMFGEHIIVIIGIIAVMVGHSYSLFIGFKGGKGIASAVGIYLALAPIPLLITTVVFVLILAIWRMMSLSSIVGAVTLAIVVIINSSWLALQITTLCLAAFVVYRHRSNITRILRKEERKVDFLFSK